MQRWSPVKVFTVDPTRPTVFISYSHRDEDWKNRFLPQLRALEQAGRIVVWDDRKIDGGEKWYPAIKMAMEKASIAICLISADYLASEFCVKEEVPFLLQRCEREGMIFIPILLRPCPWNAFDWLKEIQMIPRDGKSVAVDFRGIEDAAFAEVANLVFKYVDNPLEYDLVIPIPSLSVPPGKIDVNRLPITGAELFGRQKEMALLDDAWTSADTNIVGLIASGGVGKSTLVNKWLERMRSDNYRGASHVYGWSFYSQGTGERVTSADQFFNQALCWFGDSDPNLGSPWEKGERLAKLIQRERTILILDGLEPLQSGHSVEKGRIDDPGLAKLLTELAVQNQGLCVITTRERLSDLNAFSKSSVQEDLEQISSEAGRALLRVGGVQGTDPDLEEATRDFGNHALALNLLAVYLHGFPGHDISHACEIEDLYIDEEDGKHPKRVMSALAERFGDGPELELLSMLGLFDRPASETALRALRKAPAIHGLSDNIRKLTEAGWLRTLEKLRSYRLIAPLSSHLPDEVDTHPLVREYFGQQLKKQKPSAWKSGHRRLYEYLKKKSKMYPETLIEMAPLYKALAHGCYAERHQEAFESIYWRRILRGDEYFSSSVLGAVGAELSALSCFFDSLWDEPAKGLTTKDKSFVLNQAGLNLMSLGRLAEAIEPTKAALELALANEEWKNAAIDSCNLSGLYLNIGDLSTALSIGQRSVDLSDQAVEFASGLSDGALRLFELQGAIDQQAICRARRAEIFHALGSFSEAESEFKSAEEKQNKGLLAIPYLYTVPGFHYCEFLLEQHKWLETKTRAENALKWSNGLLSEGLAYVSLGAADWGFSGKGGFEFSDIPALRHLDRGIDCLRRSNQRLFLPYGLLARSRVRRALGQLDSSMSDLKESLEIAQGSGMKLHEADCLLEYARLSLAQGESQQANQYWKEAKEKINETNYRRRDEDLNQFEKELTKFEKL